MKKLFLKVGLAQFGFSILALFLTSAINSTLQASLISLLIGGLLFGWLTSRKLEEKNTFYCILPIAYTASLWAIFIFITWGALGKSPWMFYSLLHLPFLPVFFMANMEGEGRIFLWAPLAFELAFVLPIVIKFAALKKLHMISRRNTLILFSIVLLAIGSGMAVQWQRSKSVLPSYGFKYGGGYSSTDLSPYRVSNPDHVLPKLDEASEYVIKDPKQMPVMDGAEAAYPVYSAFANAVYENAKAANNQKEIISFTNTIYAFERLLSKEVDIYFGAEPSSAQREMAKKAGAELVMTPIGKEAFVFFVNPENQIDRLTVSEIQSIYSGELKNWSQLEGKSKNIVAFQRPADSGSQTLLEKIMGDKPIIQPLKEETPAGMGGIIEQVADYRNFDNAIGFSFRFFATGMRKNEKIKLLSINGISPSPENIASEKYPFTASLYAITLKSNKKKTIPPFLEWMKGSQGQELVEKVGYIKN
ncbi:substrate-binding domain-containing protein [Metabacillus sp. FJAT-52054]|uniref:Substrate-binding domain-containing protein n=1 Tax=Metabacillus sediminis TaxID=3117746 RepID=A0ABZ2NEB7_9BACI